jgi:penicillin-binding protein 1A
MTETGESGPRLRQPRRRPPSRLLALLIALALGVPSGFAAARMIRRPLVKSLDTYSPDVITRLYTKDGEVLAEYAIQRRIVVRKKDMAPAIVNAIIATEDSSFYEHGGIDPKAIIRAARANLVARRKVEGASTLTQQLAKQLFLTPEKSWRRKINEAFLAIEIEKQLTKDQIFELYANQVIFGHGAYGVEAASRLYFGKHASELTVPEAAVLGGLIRRPEYYSPINNPDNALRRRNHVLRRMLAEEYITEDEYNRALNTPVVLGSYKEETPRVGAYFSEQVRQYIERSPKFGTEDLYRNGLNIWTTLDLKVQAAAESALRRGLHRFDHRRGFRKPTRNLITEGIDPEAFQDPSWKEKGVPGDLVRAVVLAVDRSSVEARIADRKMTLGRSSWAWTRKESMNGLLKRGDLIYIREEPDPKTKEPVATIEQTPLVQGAVVVLDVKTGEVRALVGGYDFHASKFNRAVQSLRQTGSAFKPFVYGAAFENGFTPADTIVDAPVSIRVGNQIYSPRNYDGRFSGVTTMQRALDLSINIPAVKTYLMVGGKNVIDFVRRTGVTAPLQQYPSLALGAAGISPLELTAAFNVFANQGVYVKPRMIRKITDATQKVLEENYAELSEATSAQTAFVLAHMMQGPVDRGTAFSAHTLPGAIAGKTGTTNGFTDAWFVGFSPEYSIGIWVGYDDPNRTLGGGSTGAEVALPIWIDVYKQMVDLKLTGMTKEFSPPAGVVIVPMELRTGRQGTGGCGRVVPAAFVAGTEPDKNCSGEIVSVSKMASQLDRVIPRDLQAAASPTPAAPAGTPPANPPTPPPTPAASPTPAGVP